MQISLVISSSSLSRRNLKQFAQQLRVIKLIIIQTFHAVMGQLLIATASARYHRVLMNLMMHNLRICSTPVEVNVALVVSHCRLLCRISDLMMHLTFRETKIVIIRYPVDWLIN